MIDYSRFRIGIGFDTHPFDQASEAKLVLGGIEFDNEALVAHSDGDALVHALVDSILTPAGLGDIGALFSDQSPENQDRSSIEFLTYACNRLASEGWEILNSDCVVVADQPKIRPKVEAIESKMSEIMGAPVTVKGKRTEGVTHNVAAISCHVSTLLLAPEGQ